MSTQAPATHTRAGWVWYLPTNSQRRAFSALVPVKCSQCCDTIPPGSLFTKHGTRENRHACAPLCWHCGRFELIPPHMQRQAVRRIA